MAIAQFLRIIKLFLGAKSMVSITLRLNDCTNKTKNNKQFTSVLARNIQLPSKRLHLPNPAQGTQVKTTTPRQRPMQLRLEFHFKNLLL